ncbi:MAG: hypothetical protein U0W40_00710 [Acidimicrobiia bacterium]
MPAPLSTTAQDELEELVLRLRATEPVRRAAAELRERYAADPIAASASARATLDAAVDSVVTAALVEAVVLDAGNPRTMWFPCAEHTWNGRTFPNSGYGIENPDNVYRHLGIDDAGTFVLEGRYDPGAPRPMDFSIVVYGEVPGTGAMDPEGAPILGVFSAADLLVGADGTFTLTVGPDADADLRVAPGAELLIVRESLSDWTTEMPCALTVRRTTPATAPSPTEAELADRGAHLAAQLGRYWGLDYNHASIYPRPVNTVMAVRRRGIGMATAGHFDLAPEEAFVVTVDPKGARYLGFQLADPWGVARPYVDRTGSLSNAQAHPNDDGTFTYVIAADDPGVWNWLDTGGLAAGMFAIRWQPVAPATTPDGAVVRAEVVAFDRLADALPGGTHSCDGDERRAQLAARRAAYDRRFLG